jgi:hypothetical protein
MGINSKEAIKAKRREWRNRNKQNINAYAREYRILHKKECKEAIQKWRKNKSIHVKNYNKAWLRLRRLRIISHYSNGKSCCYRCGNTDLRVLSIDHINSGGCKHTKELIKQGTNLYTWIIKNNFPSGFQILCMNCQWIKRYEKQEIPHQRKQEQDNKQPTILLFLSKQGSK